MDTKKILDAARDAFRTQCEKNGIPYGPATIAAFNNAITEMYLALQESELENEDLRSRRQPRT